MLYFTRNNIILLFLKYNYILHMFNVIKIYVYVIVFCLKNIFKNIIFLVKKYVVIFKYILYLHMFNVIKIYVYVIVFCLNFFNNIFRNIIFLVKKYVVRIKIYFIITDV